MTIHHVFVFRHCVRSTAAELEILDAQPSAFSSNPADYFVVSQPSALPDWQTAPMGCTATGAQLVQAVGQYLVDTYLPQFVVAGSRSTTTTTTTTTSKLRVRFVTDTDNRDVDTSLKMMQGMANALVLQQQQQQDDPSTTPTTTITTIQGLNTLEYDAALFKPTSVKWDTAHPFCPRNASRTERNRIVTQRFQTIPPPATNYTLPETLDWMQQLGGGGGDGTGMGASVGGRPVLLSAMLPTTFVNTNVSQLGGQINVVDYMAEAAFYSKASGIDCAAFDNMTQTTQLFDQLVAWHYWKRTIEQVDNNHAAMLGSVLVDRVLKALAAPNNNDNDEDDEVDQIATFYIGHDGNLNQIATALGLSWTLPAPYPSGPDGIWRPTPPHSALHFMYDSSSNSKKKMDDAVRLSVLTPMYFNDNKNNELVLNTTGILEERPVVFDKADDDDDNDNISIQVGTRDTTFATSQDDNNDKDSSTTRSALDALRNRMESRLQQYNDDAVMACYQKAQGSGPTMAPTIVHNNNMPTTTTTDYPTITHTTKNGGKPSPPKQKASSAKGKVFSVWMAFIFMSVILYCLVRSVRRRQRGRRGGSRSATYTEMGDARHDLDFEMT